MPERGEEGRNGLGEMEEGKDGGKEEEGKLYKASLRGFVEDMM